jgi:hypothetical protein
MRAVTAVSSARRPTGVRRYRVWWLEGRIEIVPACASTRLPAREGALAMLLLMAGLCGIGAFAPLAGLVPGIAWGIGAWRHARLRHRARCLRRQGATPGPWVWAIDAESAACTARIRAVVGDQPRRMPSMRIQSPSCSQRSSSNHAA